MKEELNFHDRELIALFCNPGTNTMQINISYRPDKILEIYIKDIEKIEEYNSDSLSLFFLSAATLDDGELDKNILGDSLRLSGIEYDSNYKSVYWSFKVSAKEINYKFSDVNEEDIIRLEKISFIDMKNINNISPSKL